MARRRILVVDDEPRILEVCGRALAALPETQVILEGDCPRAAGRLEAEDIALLITDMINPPLASDVHMRLRGASLSCAECHSASKHQVRGRGVNLVLTWPRWGSGCRLQAADDLTSPPGVWRVLCQHYGVARGSRSPAAE